MTKIKSKITPDTILKNFWKDNNRFADLFNACFFDGNPRSTMQCRFDICLEMHFLISKNITKLPKNIKMKNLMEHQMNFYKI